MFNTYSITLLEKVVILFGKSSDSFWKK